MTSKQVDQLLGIEVPDEREGLPSSSTMERIYLCPGSRYLSTLVPPEKPGKWAESGTRVHEYLAEPSQGKLDKLTKDEKKTVTMCLDLTGRVMEKHGFTDLGGIKAIEQRLWAIDEDMQKVYSGRFDSMFGVKEEHRLLVLDYKAGRGEVTEAISNWQGRTLATLAAQHYGATEVVFAIIQPWASPQVDDVIYDEKALIEADEACRRVEKDSRGKEAPRFAGVKQCQFCPAKGRICPEAFTAALSVELHKGDLLHPATLGKRLEIYKICEEVIERERERAKKMLAEDPGSVPGWKLQNTGNIRKVTNIDLAELQLMNTFSEEEWRSVLTLKLTEAEALYCEKKGLGDKEGKKQFTTELVDSGAMELKEKAKSLVRDAK